MSDHNKIIKKIAKSKFKPLGIVQKGSSRTFLLDKGWYSLVIEFQPHGYYKGTFLNIGACFHFYPKEYYSYDYNSRELDFVKYEDDESFLNEIVDYCDLAIKRIEELTQELETMGKAFISLEAYKLSDDIWRSLYLGILSGLLGNKDKAESFFDLVIKDETFCDWQEERKNFTEQSLVELKNDNFRKYMESVINNSRQLKKLPIIGF